MSRLFTSNDQKQVDLLFSAPAVRFRFKRPRPISSGMTVSGAMDCLSDLYDPLEWHLRQGGRSYFIGSESAARKALSDVLRLGGRCADLFEQGAGV